MNLARYIREHRSGVTLCVLVTLSLVSLLTGTRSTIVHRGIERLVAISSYPFLKAKDAVQDGVNYLAGTLLEYDALREENGVLQEEVVALKKGVTRRGELERENARLRKMLAFVRTTPRLTLEPVEVVESYKGTLRIDRGALHGMQLSMGVVTADGVVGVVTEVDDFTSIVATLHHSACKVGAMVRRNRLRAYDGVVHASGSDLRQLCAMHYIDLKDDVRVGDRVVTSPESIFPAGYPIGVVTAWHDSGSLWKTAEIEPYVDPYRLDEVFVVRQATPQTEDFAGAPRASEPPPAPLAAATPETPDLRSVQERYAP